MIYGYARVSTDAQSFTTELADLKAAGCTRMCQGGVTRISADRSQLNRMMTTLVDPLPCVPTDLRVLARLRSSAESTSAATSDFADIILAAPGVVAKLYRNRIPEHTARDRAPAKANGMRFGLRPKLTARQQREAAERVQAEEPQRSVVRSHNVNQSTIAQSPSEGAAYG